MSRLFKFLGMSMKLKKGFFFYFFFIAFWSTGWHAGLPTKWPTPCCLHFTSLKVLLTICYQSFTTLPSIVDPTITIHCHFIRGWKWVGFGIGLAKSGRTLTHICPILYPTPPKVKQVGSNFTTLNNLQTHHSLAWSNVLSYCATHSLYIIID